MNLRQAAEIARQALTLDDLKAEVIRTHALQAAALNSTDKSDAAADECDAACFEFDHACIMLALRVCNLKDC